MADANLNITATFNIKEAINSAVELEREFQHLDVSTDKYAKSIATSFNEAEKSLVDNFNQTKNQISSLSKDIERHKTLLEGLEKDERTNAFFSQSSNIDNHRRIEEERAAIADLSREYENAQKALSGYQDNLRIYGDEIEKARAYVELYKQSIKDVTNAPDAATRVASQSFKNLGQDISGTIETIKARNNELNEQIATQKSAVAGLAASLKELKSHEQTPKTEDNISQKNAELIRERKTLKDLIDERIRSKAVLEELNQVHKQYGQTIRDSSDGQEMFRTRMLKLTEALRRLREQNLDTTSTYGQLESELVKLKLTSKSIEKNMNALATPNAGLKATLDLGQGVTGVYTGLQSITALLGEDNEELAKTFFKVQAALQTLNAVQMVANTLQKNSISNTVIRNTLSKMFRSNTEKEALATVIASQALKADTTAKVANAAATGAATTATKSFTAALLKNPVTAIITAVVALGTALYFLASRTSDAEKAQKRLNEAQGEYFKDVLTETTKLDLYVQRLSKAKEGTKGYYQAKKDLMDMAGKYNVSVETESGRIKDLKGTYEQLADAIRDVSLAKAQENALQKAGEAYGKTTSDSYDKLLKNLTKLQTKFDKPVDQLINEIFADINQGNSLESILDEYFSFISETGLKTGYGKRIKSALEDIIEARNTFQDEVSKGTAQFSTKTIEKEIEGLEKYKQQLSDLQAEWDKLEPEEIWKDRSKGIYTDRAKELKKQIDDIQKVIQGYEILSAKQQDNEAEKAAKASKKIAELQVQAQIDADKARMNAMEDGRTKRLQEIQNEYDQTIATINKNEAALKEEYKKAGKTYTQEDADVFAGQRTSAGTDRDRKTKKANEQYEEEAKKLFTDLGYLYQNDTLSFMTEQQRKDYAFKQSLEKMRKEAKEALAGGTITQEQYNAISTAIDRSELDQLVEKYKTTEAKIKEIIETSNEEIAKLRAKGREKEAREAEKARDKAVAQITADELQNSEEWIKLFNNIDDLSAKAIFEAVEKLRVIAADALRAGKLTAEEYANLSNTLTNAEQTGRDKNPFTGAINGFKAYKQAIENATKLREKYNETQDENDKKAADQAGLEAIKKRNEAWGKLGEAVAAIGDILNSITPIAEALGADEDTVYTLNNMASAIGGIGQAAYAFSKGDIMSGISGVASALGSIFNLFNNDRKHEKRIHQEQKNIDKLADSYDRLGEAIENAYSTGASQLIEKQNENLLQQNEAIRRQIKEENAKKKTDSDKIDDWNKKIEENNRLIEENQKKAIEAIMGTGVKNAIDDFAQAYVDAWASGESAAEKSADVVKKLLQGAFVEQIKKGLQPRIEDLFNYIAQATTDGLDAAEEAEIERRRQEIDAFAKEYEDKYGKYFQGESDVNSMKGQVSAALTEETANKSMGIWRLQVDLLKAIQTDIYKQAVLQQSSLKINTNIFSSVMKIESNTARTAANTEGLYDKMSSMDNRLRNIEQNTNTKYYGK